MLQQLIEIIICIFLLVCLWGCINYFLLMVSKYQADICFRDLSKKIKEQYYNIRSFLSRSSDYVKDTKLVNETQTYISNALNFTIKDDGNERIIGYANAIFNNVKKIITEIKENSDKNNTIEQMIQNYMQASKEFEEAKNRYILTSKKLRHYVDVFPTSLMARLKNIKTMDYIN